MPLCYTLEVVETSPRPSAIEKMRFGGKVFDFFICIYVEINVILHFGIFVFFPPTHPWGRGVHADSLLM